MERRRTQERGFTTSSQALAPLPEDQEYRCSGRVRMRRWLMSQVMSGKYTGLKWIDKDKTLLRIPWKHGSRSGWSAEDGKLFESWAIQSGKFDPLHPNARKWKANFRCALRSLPDVEEVKNLSHKTGKDAYKIFRFLPEKQRRRCYKSNRSWRPNYPISVSKPDVYERPDLAPHGRPEVAILERAEGIVERKLIPGEVLNSMSYSGSHDDHRRLGYGVDVTDVRSSPSRFWTHHQAPQPMNFCRPPDIDTGSWPLRTQPPSPPRTTLPTFSTAPFNDLPCEQYPNSFASPQLAADPPSHPSFRSGAFISDTYLASDTYASASAAEYNEMAAYPGQYFDGLPHAQPEMTDISNFTNFPQWPNGTENFMAEVFDVMQQQVLRDRCVMTNDILYGDDLEQFEGKPVHS